MNRTGLSSYESILQQLAESNEESLSTLLDEIKNSGGDQIVDVLMSFQRLDSNKSIAHDLKILESIYKDGLVHSDEVQKFSQFLKTKIDGFSSLKSHDHFIRWTEKHGLISQILQSISSNISKEVDASQQKYMNYSLQKPEVIARFENLRSRSHIAQTTESLIGNLTSGDQLRDHIKENMELGASHKLTQKRIHRWLKDQGYNSVNLVQNGEILMNYDFILDQLQNNTEPPQLGNEEIIKPMGSIDSLMKDLEKTHDNMTKRDLIRYFVRQHYGRERITKNVHNFFIEKYGDRIAYDRELFEWALGMSDKFTTVPDFYDYIGKYIGKSYFEANIPRSEDLDHANISRKNPLTVFGRIDEKRQKKGDSDVLFVNIAKDGKKMIQARINVGSINKQDESFIFDENRGIKEGSIVPIQICGKISGSDVYAGALSLSDNFWDYK